MVGTPSGTSTSWYPLRPVTQKTRPARPRSTRSRYRRDHRGLAATASERRPAATVWKREARHAGRATVSAATVRPTPAATDPRAVVVGHEDPNRALPNAARPTTRAAASPAAAPTVPTTPASPAASRS